MRAIIMGLTVVLLAVQPAPAQNVSAIKAALQTTIFHTGELAQRGTALAGPLLHLQHTANCLEGEKGKDFKAAVGNPCQGQGNGIIPDLTAAKAAGVKGADRALQYASIALTLTLQGLQSRDVDEAQPWALVISRQLKIAQESL